MKNAEKTRKWLKRAKSNLACTKVGKVSPEILYEDLCFDAQQAVEKALKALCIRHGIVFRRTHDIAYLIEILEKGKVNVPEDIQRSKLLTDYAVETRYPGDYPSVDEEAYKEALEIAERVVNWVEREIGDNEQSSP